jgi:hypothetical protein
MACNQTGTHGCMELHDVTGACSGSTRSSAAGPSSHQTGRDTASAVRQSQGRQAGDSLAPPSPAPASAAAPASATPPASAPCACAEVYEQRPRPGWAAFCAGMRWCSPLHIRCHCVVQGLLSMMCQALAPQCSGSLTPSPSEHLV